jgi:hypothetical protein
MDEGRIAMLNIIALFALFLAVYMKGQEYFETIEV